LIRVNSLIEAFTTRKSAPKMSSLDELLAKQLEADTNDEDINNDDDNGDDDNDGDDDDVDADDLDDEQLANESDDALLQRASKLVTEKRFDDACDLYSLVLDRRRQAGHDDISLAQAEIFLRYGAALLANAQANIDALCSNVASFTKENTNVSDEMKVRKFFSSQQTASFVALTVCVCDVLATRRAIHRRLGAGVRNLGMRAKSVRAKQVDGNAA
jgi:hypothetical protein